MSAAVIGCVFAGSLWLVGVTMMLRNNWTLRYFTRVNKDFAARRMRMLDSGDYDYIGLPEYWYTDHHVSYEWVMLHFWVWNPEKFWRTPKSCLPEYNRRWDSDVVAKRIPIHDPT